LAPINLAEHLAKVDSIWASLTRSRHLEWQLDYGRTRPISGDPLRERRIYDMDALETVMLINQAKDKALTSRRIEAAALPLEAGFRLPARSAVFLRRDLFT